MEEETICVPPCVDVLPFAHRGPFNRAPEKARGQSGENKFLQQFVQLKLGGILIGGLDSKDLRNAGKNASAPVKLDDAVDAYYRTVSYEWPVVFIVFRRGDESVTKENVISIAAPRCIAKLSIIEYDKRTIVYDEFVKEYEDCSSVTTENYDSSDSDQPFTSTPECYTEDSDAGEWHTEEEQRWILVKLNILKNSYIDNNLQ
uniref:Uncharacterized protein n=1 Tax=Plectus sambesii TaxID=2011161 RepID=A0A914W553_9BILA